MAEGRAKRALTKSPEGTASVPPLLRFIRALLDAQKEGETNFFDLFLSGVALVNGKPTTKVYLYQLAGNELPNPTLRLAKALVEQSRVFAPRVNARPLTYEDLLVGCVPTRRLAPKSIVA